MKTLILAKTITVFMMFCMIYPVFAQNVTNIPEGYVKRENLNGPRVGMIFLGPGKDAERLDDYKIAPIMTFFGWNQETKYFELPNGTSGIIQGVVGIAGLEQSTFLPTGSLMVGLREKNGWEFGFGPNLSISGAAFVIGVGKTTSIGGINFPFNFAVVPSRGGVRYSLTFGFNAAYEKG
ncbi:hypothetical protein [Marinoscillum sp. MHG1-6]|uniref:hypothetical protein n=1 Tax=Marinoscillum sp. MHG1-6 TaxID=2959627 RepID=UPI0021589016|nr:hypothetical protein [Marinoscillum sp. MHG1-6]